MISLRNNLPVVVVAGFIIMMGLYRTADQGGIGPTYEMVMRLAGIVAFGVVLMRANVFWGLFLILVGFSSVWPSYNAYSQTAMMNILVACIWYYYIVQYVKEDHIDHILDAICFISVVSVISALVQFYSDGTFHYFGLEMSYGDPTGLSGNKNGMSAVMAMAVPAFMRPRRYVFVWIPLLGLILADSFGGLLAVGVGFVAWGFLWGRGKTVVAVVFVSMALFAVFIDAPSGSSRLDTWRLGWDTYLMRPIHGWGLGQWALVMKDVKIHGLYFMQAHNDVLQGMFELGIGFFVLLLGWFAQTIGRIHDCDKYPVMALFIIGTNALVNFPFHVGFTAMLSVTWLAILEKKLRSSN